MSKRRINLKVCISAALLAIIVCGFSMHNTKNEANKAIRNAESNADILAYELDEATTQLCDYIEQNQRLTEDNNMLRSKLLIYTDSIEVQATAPPRYFDVALDEDIQDFIWYMCCSYDIVEHYELVFALIKQESNFNSDAISSTDDYGLMQINVINHTTLSEVLGITDFLDPYQNIHGGIYLLSTLLHKYDVVDALMAYNLGERGAKALWNNNIHSTEYAESVMKYYYQFIKDI